MALYIMETGHRKSSSTSLDVSVCVDKPFMPHMLILISIEHLFRICLHCLVYHCRNVCMNECR